MTNKVMIDGIEPISEGNGDKQTVVFDFASTMRGQYLTSKNERVYSFGANSSTLEKKMSNTRGLPLPEGPDTQHDKRISLKSDSVFCRGEPDPREPVHEARMDVLVKSIWTGTEHEDAALSYMGEVRSVTDVPGEWTGDADTLYHLMVSFGAYYKNGAFGFDTVCGPDEYKDYYESASGKEVPSEVSKTMKGVLRSEYIFFDDNRTHHSLDMDQRVKCMNFLTENRAWREVGIPREASIKHQTQSGMAWEMKNRSGVIPS